MGSVSLWGAFAFGLVIGWVTYRTLRRTKQSGLSDIATVIGAVGGATVTGLFQKGTDSFGFYGIGLAVGFFFYLIVSVALAAKTNTLPAVNEWLGEPQQAIRPGSGALDEIK
jgi:uncharacterized membrane protein YeaQ/YmgE (transglycosylase-associated protein family)